MNKERRAFVDALMREKVVNLKGEGQKLSITNWRILMYRIEVAVAKG